MAKNLNKRFTLRNIIIIIGSVVTIFSTISLMQVSMMDLESLNSIKEVWKQFMPLLAIIGISYLIFGVLFEKISKNKLLIHILVCIASLLWFAFYVNALSSKISLEGFNNIVVYFYYLGIVFGFLIMIIPQLLIGIKIYKLRHNY